MGVAATVSDPLLPHCLTADDILGPGPSPRYTCTRPSCGLVYRTLAFVRHVPPPCPACQQPWMPCRVHITPIQREMTQEWSREARSRRA